MQWIPYRTNNFLTIVSNSTVVVSFGDDGGFTSPVVSAGRTAVMDNFYPFGLSEI